MKNAIVLVSHQSVYRTYYLILLVYLNYVFRQRDESLILIGFCLILKNRVSP